ncbi:MAG: hypothetical protein V4456_22135 [Bacteroidota bacterium]
MKKKTSKNNAVVKEPQNAPIIEPINSPIIYAYIYEREPNDLEKLYKSHQKSEAKETVDLISGFEIIDNELVPKLIEKEKKRS